MDLASLLLDEFTVFPGLLNVNVANELLLMDPRVVSVPVAAEYLQQKHQHLHHHHQSHPSTSLVEPITPSPSSTSSDLAPIPLLVPPPAPLAPPQSSTRRKGMLFECLTCGMLFKTKKELKQHSIIHTNEKPFECLACGKTFKRAMELRSHSLVHSDEKPFTCEQCPAAYKRATDLKIHMMDHSNMRDYACNDLTKHSYVHSRDLRTQSSNMASDPDEDSLAAWLDGDGDSIEFASAEAAAAAQAQVAAAAAAAAATELVLGGALDSLDSLDNMDNMDGLGGIGGIDAIGMDIAMDLDAGLDMDKNNNSNNNNNNAPPPPKLLACGQCPATFTNTHQLNAHSLVHSDVKPYKCDLCSATFKRPAELPQHMLYNHMGNREFACKTCEEKFSSQKELRDHNLTHMSKQYMCPICSKLFASANLLQSHGLVHTSEKPYQCLQCPATFKRSEYLRQHALVHSDAKPFVCSECQEGFKRAQQLKLHQLKHVKAAGAFKCKQCQAPFDSREELQTHSKEAHSLACPTCNVVFKRPHLYEKHVASHNGGGKAASDLVEADADSDTSSVVATPKTNSKLSCKQCKGKEFPSKEALLAHKRLHKTETCDICQRKFSSSSNLKVHIRTKHGNGGEASGSNTGASQLVE
ncbi:hypothetical protein BDR26DRAFT_937045 [Obelidium mucronatum]|nr:hypothetical protein BDR26DRAFT_937045 [Obelidium mucronatum]